MGEMLRTALLSIQTLCDSLHALRSNQQRLELRLAQLELHLGSLHIHPFQPSSRSFQPPSPQFIPSPFVAPPVNNGHVTNGSNMIPLAFHGGGSDDADSVDDVGGGGDGVP